MTKAEDFLNDPRIEQARALLHEAMQDHQHAMDDVCEADDERIAVYDEALAHFGEQRGGSLFYRYLGSGLGCGPLVELDDGSVKFDMIGGIGVHGLGHSHPALLDAGLDAALRDTVMQGNLQQNTESAKLVDALIELAQPSALKHCFLTTSGAMANENALKLAFARRHPADRLLAFEHCFAGRTLALAQVTDKAAYRVGLPATIHVDHVPFYDGQNTDEVVRTIEHHLAAHPGRHAGMMLEMIQGEGGYYPGDRAFFLAVTEVLRKHGVAVIVDEVQTFGRTDRLFAFQHFGLDDRVDIVTIGKITQVCATLFSDDYKPKPGLVSQTFTGSTSSILAAGVVLRELQTNLLANLEKADHFRKRFADYAARYPDRMRGPFGYGGMLATTVFEGSPQTTKDVLHHLFKRGVIAFLAGSDPMRLRMLPPLSVMSGKQIDRVCDILDRSLDEIAEQRNNM